MKRIGLVLIAVLIYAMAPADGPKAQEGTDCVLFCTEGSEAGCPENLHKAEWPQLWEEADAMRGEGSHPTTCYKFVCAVKHPFCIPETQQQASLSSIFNALEGAINAENGRALRRMLRKFDDTIRVNANRRAIQVVACDETIIGHLEGSEDLIQSLQR